MKPFYKVLLSAFVIAGLTYFISACLKNDQNPKTPQFRGQALQAQKKSSIKTDKVSSLPAAKRDQKKLSSAEAPVEIAKMMKNLLQKKLSMNSFVKALQSNGLQVVVSFDRQKGLDDLSIVRAQNSLPGVRYIHAQFSGDNRQKQHRLRNFSFETPKGPNALTDAAGAMKSVFQISERDRLVDFDNRMIVYKVGEYLCYVSELNSDFMINHPFNAYDLENDVGVIRWACDQDIHPHNS
jgi:hypothetical protein